MSENNYGALMMKSAIGASDDINAIFQPGIYIIPPSNTSSPDATGGVLTVHSGTPIRRTFTSDSVICLTSTRNGSTWSLWKGPLSRINPFADIKADGAAAVAAALSNLGLVGGLASDAVGRLIGVKIITASTTYAATPGTKKVLAIITGGGGSGGSCSATTTGSTFSGAGGGAGGTCIGLLNLADATNKAITIGAGGAAELAGGSTTFAGMVAGGGGGGGYTGVTSTPGGTSGTATGGIMNILGGHGGDGQSGAYLISGMGGGSLWGTGGRSGQNAGISSIVYGAGGGGAYDTGFSGTKRNGGNGAPGVAVILEFA